MGTKLYKDANYVKDKWTFLLKHYFCETWKFLEHKDDVEMTFRLI